MRRSRKLGLGCVIAAWASLLLARVHPFGDAQLGRSPLADALILGHEAAPAEVRSLLLQKCADCHSTQTRTHFYGRFAPASWLMERDILAGREHMNLSTWDLYSPDQQQAFKAKMVQQVKAGSMPLPQYLLVHWTAHISEADVNTLQTWAHQVASATPVAMQIAAGGEGDSVRGKVVFEKRCTGCHAMEADREGPRLKDVYGRTSGTVAGFAYSDALKKAHLVWSDAALDRWLTDPDKLVPGNDMDFQVARPDERRDLIRYLKESSEK